MTAPNATDWKDKLYFGENLPIMREHIPDEFVSPRRHRPRGESRLMM